MTDDYYTLADAALWIAFRDMDKPLDYILSHWDMVAHARDIILPNALLSGRIHISSNQTDNIIFRELYQLDFDRNMIFVPSGGFCELTTAQSNIRISTADLHKEFPISTVTGTKIETGYTAPYLDVANAVINRIGITADNQPPKKNITDIIKDELTKRHLPCSNRKAEEIATLIRLPEREKGGYIRTKPHKNP